MYKLTNLYKMSVKKQFCKYYILYIYTGEHMAFCNFSLNFNIFNNCGVNNLFTPFSGFSFSGFNMPNFNSFNFSGFFNFNMPSLFNYPSSDMGNFMPYPSIDTLKSPSFGDLAQFNLNAMPNIATLSFNSTGNLWNQVGMNFTPNWNTDTFSRSIKSSKVILAQGVPSNYNATLGKKLANIALRNARGSFGGSCARYVKTAISQAGAGEYKSGHGYQMTNILKNNKNFKQISPNSVNVNDLPAGCVLVYAKGAQGYNSKYGHTEITTGDGKGVSDGITKKLLKPTAIFVPVTA